MFHSGGSKYERLLRSSCFYCEPFGEYEFLIGVILVKCRICSMRYSCKSDKTKDGWFCDNCDSFTSYSGIYPLFKVLLEEKGAEIFVNKPDIKLSKRLSPLRYPGGKSKFIDYLYSSIKDIKVDKIVSPYTGGGSFELSMLEAGVISDLVINDKDYGIASLWDWIFSGKYENLIDRIYSYIPSKEDYFDIQYIVLNKYKGLSREEAAWNALLLNRFSYSGIPYANPLGGRAGTYESYTSRWNPRTLEKRVRSLGNIEGRVSVYNTDALDVISENSWTEGSLVFIDPPYLAKGDKLYNHHYEEKDHIELSVLLNSLHTGTPASHFLVTYDYHSFIESLYPVSEIEKVSRFYSI